MMPFNESFCTSIAVANIMSAHSMSEDFNDRTFRSTNRRSHDFGSNADTVNKPSGGKAQRFPSNGSAWRKLQYVSGNSGFTNRIFIASSSNSNFLQDRPSAEREDERLSPNSSSYLFGRLSAK